MACKPLCRAPRQRHDKFLLDWSGRRRHNYLVVPFLASAARFRLVVDGPVCITGASGHFCLISALDTKHASTIQPFAYLQLVFASTIGIVIVDDQLDRIDYRQSDDCRVWAVRSEPRAPRQIVNSAPLLAALASRPRRRYRHGHPAILVPPFGYFFDNPCKLQHPAVASFHKHIKLPPSIT